LVLAEDDGLELAVALLLLDGLVLAEGEFRLVVLLFCVLLL
jgi:hypothetical protein